MFDLLVTGVHLATMTVGSRYGTIRDGALGIVGDRIAWVGAERDLPRDAAAHRLLHVPGAWATPGLFDCHSHVVYAGTRASEFEARQYGATYAELAYTQTHGIRCALSGSPFVGFVRHQVSDLTASHARESSRALVGTPGVREDGGSPTWAESHAARVATRPPTAGAPGELRRRAS